MQPRPHNLPRGSLRDALQHAEQQYLRAAADGGPAIDALLEEHPQSLRAHVLKIAQLVAAKDAAALPALERALRAAAPLEPYAGPADLAHLAAARAWLEREPLRAAKIYTQLVTEGDPDALALRLAQ